MPAMTHLGARMILEGYRIAIGDIEKFHRTSLDILERFILNGENHETINVFGNELVYFMDELMTEASERQLSGPIHQGNNSFLPLRLVHDDTGLENPDQLSAPICNWVHTRDHAEPARDLAWSKNGEN